MLFCGPDPEHVWSDCDGMSSKVREEAVRVVLAAIRRREMIVMI
jgi:hypothetical protein